DVTDKANTKQEGNYYKRSQYLLFFFPSRRRHTRFSRDWSSDVCSSDLGDGRGSSHTGPGDGSRGRFVVTANPELIMRAQGDPAEIGRATCRERVFLGVDDAS